MSNSKRAGVRKMAFARLARAVVDQSKQETDYVKTVRWMLENALGHAQAKPIPQVLGSVGLRCDKKGFQQTILKRSRADGVFIGSSKEGIFIIEDMNDAVIMKEFYENRIRAEQTHRQRLINCMEVEWGYVGGQQSMNFGE